MSKKKLPDDLKTFRDSYVDMSARCRRWPARSSSSPAKSIRRRCGWVGADACPRFLQRMYSISRPRSSSCSACCWSSTIRSRRGPRGARAPARAGAAQDRRAGVGHRSYSYPANRGGALLNGLAERKPAESSSGGCNGIRVKRARRSLIDHRPSAVAQGLSRAEEEGALDCQELQVPHRRCDAGAAAALPDDR